MPRRKNNLAVVLSVKRGEAFRAKGQTDADRYRTRDGCRPERLPDEKRACDGRRLYRARDPRMLLGPEVTVLDGLEAPSLGHMAGLAALTNALPNVPVRPYYGA
jgi:hypothetical protein